MTAPKAKLAGLARVAALCAGFTLGLTACTGEMPRTGAETPPAEADFNAGVAAYKQGDYKTAFEKFEPLAEQGYAGAQYNLGVMYDKGRGVPQDYAEAVGWWRKAAEQGHAEAQYNLGTVYHKGRYAMGWIGSSRGVPQDYAEAVRWYRKAAEQGLADAQFNLGHLYRFGKGVPQNEEAAAKWYCHAAKQGQAEALRELEGMNTTAAMAAEMEPGTAQIMAAMGLPYTPHHARPKYPTPAECRPPG